jgi:hypothetical protein
MATPAEFTTAGERLGLYKKLNPNDPPHQNFNPLQEDVRIAQENLERDSLYDNL